MIYGDITNCSVVGHGQISAYQCRMGYQVISADANTNTRQIKLQLEARTIDSRYTTTGYQLTPTIDGTPLTTIGMNFSANNVNVWQVLGSKLITITGAFNGVKYGSFTTNMTAEWGLKSGSASVTIVLDNLHMAPNITTIITEEENALLNRALQIVQYLSVKEIEFEVTTYDDATISSCQVQHNGVLIGSSTTNVVTVDFNNAGTLATYEMDGKTWATLKFVVIDSFGVIGSAEMPFEVIKYVKPNLVKTSSSIKRNGQLTGKVKMNLVGSFYSSDVNDIANTIKLEFAYWKKGGEESTTYYEIPFEPTGDSINLYSWAVKKGGVEITDINKDFAYIFKIRATDYFNQKSEIDLLCPVGEYLWAEFKNKVDFKKITIQGTDRFEYSEEEKVIGTWIDGKPIYRKVVNLNGLPNATTKTVNHNISNIDTLVKIGGFATTTDKTTITLPYVNSANHIYQVGLIANSISITIQAGDNKSGYSTAYAILEYTKTTDEV